MGVNGRTKGATAERKLAKLFAKWWGSDFARTPLSGGFATVKFRDDWNASGDLVTPDKTFPFCVESKKVEGWTLEQMLTSDKTHMHKWWAQTLKETPKDKIPLLVFTKNHAPLYAMARQEDVAHLVDPKMFMLMGEGEENRVCLFPLATLLETNKRDWLP